MPMMTLSRKDYDDLKMELATMEFVAKFIEHYHEMELDEGCRGVLKAAADYFNGAIEGRKVDLRVFTPVDQ